MKIPNDYMEKSYRMEITEDKNEGDLWFFIQICQVALLVARLWKVR